MFKTYFSGLKFGLLLQFAIGPVCLMVFNTSQNNGFLSALVLVLAVALVDALYIMLASIGASKLLQNQKCQKVIKIIGAIVLIMFGLNISLNAFDINIIPGLNITTSNESIFIQGLIITLSNPLTIIFWGSVLTSKITEDKLSKMELVTFSIGLVSATLLFLSLVALLGSCLSNFIPQIVSKILNIIIGLIIIFFGIKLSIKKKEV